MLDYYKPSEINYGDRYQIIWLLEHLKELEDGYYPKDPRETGYTDAPGKRQINKEAPFITPAEIYAELTTRIDYCGLDGKLVYNNYVDGMEIDQLAKAYKLDFYEVIKRINRCLSYITSGHDRRWHDTKRWGKITYQEWVNGKRWDLDNKVYYWIKGITYEDWGKR